MGDDQALVASWLHEESTWQQQFRGWDFSQLTSSGRISFNMSEEQLGWDYTKIICQTAAQFADSDDENKSNEIYLLDLGTGGGEYLEGTLARLPSNEKKLIVYATESYEPNFQLAKQRLTPYGVTVIQSESDSLNSLLPFTDDGPKFDLIISRHTCYNIREVDRLLKFKTGIFITQQVDGTSGQDLIELFGHQPQWPFFTLAYASLTLKNQAPSMKLIRAQESETKLVFKDIGALIIYLHAVPWMVEDFSVQKYQDVLLKLYHNEQKELAFTSKYMLLKAIKLADK
ncbi:unnamed protein product [Rotaria sordida]|uniref:Methyltransferase type 11 domain-containing protein n=1 Tax=Rotaria sordida TaxID=392033 RepID=A0A818WK60_9BILA|nr:unnamed protein product [Rotaria sordida]CAF1151340.1 unnamed protein product [Rotaria sordida]CAF1164705.1 unnamed protein product [Rotaria sordida]CAF1416160.1 unnamed protein product [Rotaria sordida]CAF3726239.1 unnamed protein product [Rotaria sordida]